MATRAQKIRLAVFLILATSVLAAFVMVAAGVQLFKKRDSYFVDFDASVSGLAVGDPVKYQGINVGRVANTSISPDDLTMVVVEISLDPGKIPNVIRRDTKAVLYSQGLMGLKYIELVAGAADAEPLPVGSHLPAASSFMGNIDERAEILTAKIERLIDNVTVLTGDENSRQLNKMLTAGGDFMESADEVLSANRESVDRSFENLAAMTESLAGTTASLHATMDSLRQMMTDGNLRSIVADLAAATHAVRLQLDGPIPDLLTNLNSMAGNIDTTITHIDRTVLQSRRNIIAAMRNLEETLENVRDATELIRQDPSIIYRGRAQE